MTIIADSGSTKTTWIDVESGNKVVTEGLNPHFSDDSHILDACHQVLDRLSSITSNPGDINNFQLSTFNFQLYFYGAGCGNVKQRERLEKLLSAGLCTGDIHVGTDMLGACRAVSCNKASIVSILGTGSNACYFDGTTIQCQPTSTGYVMGDNGSANHVGRILLNDYLTHRMPQTLRELFHDRHKMSDDQLIDAVYHGPNPNRFLASMAPFAVMLEDDDYCKKVIMEVLHNWYYGPLTTIRQLSDYQGSDLNIVGSFGKAIERQIREYLKDKDLVVGTIVADPIPGLVEFHKRHI